MSQATLIGPSFSSVCVAVPSEPSRERRTRILAALGATPGQNGGGSKSLRVDEESLASYYDYLAERLEMPFVAYYPPPSAPAEMVSNRCEVLELLDPRKHLGDEIDGLYCRTRKGKFIVNLPLAELTLMPPSNNFELLGDYEYWFWNWRNV